MILASIARAIRLDGHRAVILGGVFVGILALLPGLPLPDGILSSLVISLILFIAVLGLDVLMGYAGQVSLGQAGFMAVGGYTAAILATSYGWPPLAATLVAIVLCVLCALILSVATGAVARSLSRAGDPSLRAFDQFRRRRVGGSDRRTLGSRRHSRISRGRFRLRHAAAHVLSRAGTRPSFSLSSSKAACALVSGGR